jgi:hypothetical protein
MKKHVQTLRIHRETLLCLDRSALEKVDGGATAPIVCTSTCSQRSCGEICP